MQRRLQSSSPALPRPPESDPVTTKCSRAGWTAPQESYRPPSNQRRGGRPPLCGGTLSILPPPSLPTPSPLPRMARQPEARAFHSEFHGLIKCRGCFPGDLKALLCEPWRVRLSPAFWQQASVCLQRGLLMGGGGREGRKGSRCRKGVSSSQGQMPACRSTEIRHM